MTDVVLDVNVLVSAAIAPRGVPYQLLLAWQAGRFDVAISEHILTQLVLKLRSDRIGRRYGLTTTLVRDFTTPLRRDARLIPVPAHELLSVTGDPEDDAVLSTVRLAEANFLVTGDGGLLALSAYARARIVSPRSFLDELGG
jgi:putative PIN family toxin of toxin-antitoxin system